MLVKKFNAKGNSKISAEIGSSFPMLGYGKIMKLLRNKDVSVNGQRVSDDKKVSAGDEIMFYISEKELYREIEIVYEDENIAVVNKPSGMETVTQDEFCLMRLLIRQLRHELFAVHRLDRNTTGLVIFAKNETSKDELDRAFKQKTLHKYYLALVCGTPKKDEDKMVAYLKKYEKDSHVVVRSDPAPGYEKILTDYRVLEKRGDISLVEIELHTGKTHQIRAHFAFMGNPVLGCEKYGNSELNKTYGKKRQCLCAYKLVFCFGETSPLHYLDGVTVELQKNKIDFLGADK